LTPAWRRPTREFNEETYPVIRLPLYATVALTAVAAASCGETKPAPRAELTRDMRMAAADDNAFAFDLFGRLKQEQQGNLFFSPYSVSTAFAMTYAGARGETEQQMAEVLHLQLPQEQLHGSMGAIARDLDSTGKNRAYRLDMENRLWGQYGREFLASMGMPLPFSSEADFSGIDGRHDLSITAAAHQAYIEVNEAGAEAAAATGVTVGELSVELNVFRADHPFLFLIRDHHTGAILFLGRLVNPVA
jgi:serine protease inhibitor